MKQPFILTNDDTNLNVTMRTGPDFGCILHEQMS